MPLQAKFQLLFLNLLLSCCVFASSEIGPKDCATAFSATVHEIELLKYEVLTNYFGPKKLFGLPVVSERIKNNPAAQALLETVLTDLNPQMLDVQTGPEAVRALMDLNQKATFLNLSPQNYFEVMKQALALHRDPKRKLTAQLMLSNYIPRIQPSLAIPKVTVKEKLTLGNMIGGHLGYAAMGALITKSLLATMPGTAILLGLGVQCAGTLVYPLQSWVATRMSDAYSKRRTRLDIHETLHHIPVDEFQKYYLELDLAENTDFPTVNEFDNRIEKLLLLAEEEFRLMKNLNQELAKTRRNFTTVTLASLDVETQARFLFVRNHKKQEVKDATNTLKALKRFYPPQKNKFTGPLAPSKFSVPKEALESGDALALFRSSSGWRIKRESVTPFVILAPGNLPNTWLAVPTQQFNEALTRRNQVDLFQLNGDSLQIQSQSDSNQFVSSATSASESSPPSIQPINTVLLAPELRTKLSAENPDSRRVLRRHLVEYFFSEGKP